MTYNLLSATECLVSNQIRIHLINFKLDFLKNQVSYVQIFVLYFWFLSSLTIRITFL